MGGYGPDGQPMGGFLMDGQTAHMPSLRHPGWPSGKQDILVMLRYVVCLSVTSNIQSYYAGFQGMPGADMMTAHNMSMAVAANSSFNPSVAMSPSQHHPHAGGLSHQLRQPPVHTQPMALLPAHQYPHHHAAAAAAMMMPHHPGAGIGHSRGHIHPGQSPTGSLMNPSDIATHMLGHTC